MKSIINKKIVGAVLCMFMCMGLFACSGARPDKSEPSKTLIPDAPDVADAPDVSDDELNYVPNELIGIFEDEQQAKDAAELYKIELISFGDGVALFRYEGDLEALIELGEQNGWPQLSLNHIYKAFD